MTRYELLDRIGVGGMAEIFRGKAVAAGGFEKPVAIKRILPHLSQDARFVQLLIAEAKVLSLLKHRNIVQIFDVGLGDDGQYFLVMEYVDGRDLGAIQRHNEGKRKRLPFHLALHIGAEVCEALEHAHTAKAPDGKAMSLVHRDVSPSNVLLSRAGEIKLTDFGIAKRAEAEQTGHGAVRGKFAYISPEQARNEHIEPRSDVFSVGILMWEMVTGRRLFSGLGDLEALRAVRDAQVTPPSSVDRNIGSDVDALIMSALSKDIKRRPTAGQLGERLRSIRYSLEATGGDPATELARIIDAAEEFERQSSQSMSGFEHSPSVATSGFEDSPMTIGEATVIRIRTAEEFSMLDKNPASISDAKRVIDRFEDEETRLAQLSGDQMRLLRSSRTTHDSGEIIPPPSRNRRPTDEPTTARPPIDEDAMTMAGSVKNLVGARPGAPMPHESFEADEATRLVAPTNRRTPPPERIGPRSGQRANTAPPATGSASRPGLPGVKPSSAATAHTRSQPSRSRPMPGPPDMPIGMGPPPMPDDPPAAPDERPSQSWVPGTVHNRNPTATPDAMRISPKPQPVPDSISDSVPTPVTIAKREPPSVSSSMSRQPPVPKREPINPSAPPPMMQPPPQQPYMPQQPWAPAPQMQMQPPMQPPMQPRPSTPDMFAQRPSSPGYRKQAPRTVLQPWMLVVGALIMAALAFLVTRAFIAS